MSELTVEQKQGDRPGTTIVQVSGPLTLTSLGTLQSTLRNITSELTVIDLSEVPHMDSAGLGALLSFLTAQQKSGYRIAIAAPTKRVHMLFELTKVNTVLPIFATVSEAEQS